MTHKAKRLKEMEDRSHNLDEQLIALIKFMARKAAQDDYKASLGAISKTNKGQDDA